MKTFNKVDLAGRLYNYSLDELTRDDGGKALAGELQIEVDNKGTVVPIRYYAQPTYKNGNANKSYAMLLDIITGKTKTVAGSGDEADWISCTGNIDTSYFVAKDGSGELLAAQKVRGAFINPNGKKEYKNKWSLDMLITQISEVEPDEEKKLAGYLKVSGFSIDDYNKRLADVRFQARDESAANYIAALSASINEPYFVSIWGNFSEVMRKVVTKNAFGDDEINEYSSQVWTITGMDPEPYDFHDDTALGEEQYNEFEAALQKHKDEQVEKSKNTAKAADKDLPF